MKRQQQFARTFDFADGQLLLKKDASFDDAKDKNPYKMSCSVLYSDEEYIVEPKAVFGYATEQKRDDAFARFEEKNAKSVYMALCEQAEDLINPKKRQKQQRTRLPFTEPK